MADIELYLNPSGPSTNTNNGELQTTLELDPNNHTSSTPKEGFQETPDTAGNNSTLGCCLCTASHTW